MHTYLVVIGSRANPRLKFHAMATSSAVALEQHMELAEPTERVEVVAQPVYESYSAAHVSLMATHFPELLEQERAERLPVWCVKGAA